LFYNTLKEGGNYKMSKSKKRRIAILTGGGDCPGINAVIRAITKKAILEYNMEVIGIEDGYEGLIYNKYRLLSYDDVSGILTLGGTILGTTNKANPFHYSVENGSQLLQLLRLTVVKSMAQIEIKIGKWLRLCLF